MPSVIKEKVLSRPPKYYTSLNLIPYTQNMVFAVRQLLNPFIFSHSLVLWAVLDDVVVGLTC